MRRASAIPPRSVRRFAIVLPVLLGSVSLASPRRGAAQEVAPPDSVHRRAPPRPTPPPTGLDTAERPGRIVITAPTGSWSGPVCPMPVVRVPVDGPAWIAVIPIDTTAAIPMPTLRARCRNPLAPWEGGEVVEPVFVPDSAAPVEKTPPGDTLQSDGGRDGG